MDGIESPLGGNRTVPLSQQRFNLAPLPVQVVIVQTGQIFLWYQVYAVHLGNFERTKIPTTKRSSSLPVHMQAHLNTVISGLFLSTYQVKVEGQMQNA